MDDAKKCPWCDRWCLKDNACDYVFACGLREDNVFVAGHGCGGSWCWKCEKKYCGPYYTLDGKRAPTAKDSHDVNCCIRSDEYCGGGHNPHCRKRW